MVVWPAPLITGKCGLRIISPLGAMTIPGATVILFPGFPSVAVEMLVEGVTVVDGEEVGVETDTMLVVGVRVGVKPLSDPAALEEYVGVEVKL